MFRFRQSDFEPFPLSLALSRNVLAPIDLKTHSSPISSTQLLEQPDLLTRTGPNINVRQHLSFFYSDAQAADPEMLKVRP